MKRTSTTALFLSLFLSANANAYDNGKQLITNYYKRSSEKEYPLPQEVLEFSKFIASDINQVNALNMYPFGNNQIDFVKKRGIKSATVNFRLAAAPNQSFMQHKVTFTKEGLVEKIETLGNGQITKNTSFTYKNGMINKIKWINSGTYSSESETVILADSNGISYENTYTRNGKRNSVKKLQFNKDSRLTFASNPMSGGGVFSGKFDIHEQHYEYQNGSLKKIKEIGTIDSVSISNIVFAINYTGAYPTSSTRESITGNPYYYNLKANEFVFSNSGDSISQYRVDKNAAGNVYSKVQIEYSLDKNNTIKAVNNWALELESNDDFFNVYGAVPNNQPIQGIKLERNATNKVETITTGVNSGSFNGLDFPGHIMKFKYNRMDEQAYKIELTDRTNTQYSATVDPELTTYYDN